MEIVVQKNQTFHGGARDVTLYPDLYFIKKDPETKIYFCTTIRMKKHTTSIALETEILYDICLENMYR